jgi:hypothetical protein
MYLVIVDTTPDNKIAKYQEYETRAEANAHVGRVSSAYPNAFVVDNPALYHKAYTTVDTVAKTITFDQARWDSDQAVINSTQYQRDRATEYPPMADYLDGIVKGDQAQIDKYIADCLEIKQKHPKP